MPITKFKITENTKRTSLKVNGVLAVINQEYDIALQGLVTIENTLGFPGEPMDTFKYRIIEDGIASVNEETVTVNFETDKSSNIQDVEIIEEIAINTNFLFSDLVPPAQGFDRIIISELSGKGTWTINGNPIFVGQVILYYQLFNLLKFTANEPGAKANYNTIKWYFGNVLFNYPDLNFIQVNTTSLGILEQETSDNVPDEFITYQQYSNLLTIKNGLSNAVFKILIDTTNFVNIGVDPENSVAVTINGTTTTISTSGAYNLTGTLSESGEAEISLVSKRKKPSAVISQIAVILETINLLSANVDSLNNQETITIPITI